MEIRALSKNDDGSSFTCGDAELDRFFRQYASQNQFKHHLGVTYVAVEDGEVVGFVTVAPASIEIENLPTSKRKGLPEYPLPVLRLARLAVAAKFKGQGVGDTLLHFVLDLSLELVAKFGCTGVVVDAKPGRESYYAQYGFEPLEVLEGQSAAKPSPTPMFLATSLILKANSKKSDV